MWTIIHSTAMNFTATSSSRIRALHLFTAAQGLLQYDALDLVTWNQLLQLGGREQSKCEEAALTNRREESVGQPITTFTVLYTCQCTEFRRKSNESMASADQEFQGKSIYFYPWFDCNT